MAFCFEGKSVLGVTGLINIPLGNPVLKVIRSMKFTFLLLNTLVLKVF